MSDSLRYLFDRLLYGVAHCRLASAPADPPTPADSIDFEFLSVNAAFGTFTSLTDVAGRRARELEPEWPEALYALIGRVLRSGRTERAEIFFPNRQRWFETSAYRPAEGEFFLVLDDITSRKASEADLRFHESVLRDAGRTAKVGGWSFDPASGEGFWTEEVARIHDVDPSDPTDRDVGLSVYTATSRPRIARAIEDAVSHGTPYDLELEMVTKLGNRKWVRTIGHPTVEAGRVVRLSGSFQDITDLKHTERRLLTQNHVSQVLAGADSLQQAAPALLATLAESEHWQFAAFYVVDDEADRLRFASAWHEPGLPDGERIVDRARQLTFRAGEGLPGEVWRTGASDVRLLADLQPSDRYPRVAELVDLGFRSQLTCPVKFSGRTYGVWLFLSTEPKRADDRLPETCAAIGRQVGLFVERKRAEEALARSEARHRLVVEHASDGICLISPDLRYEEVNGRFAEMLGRPRDAFPGQRVGFGLETADAARVAGDMARLPADRPAVTEWRLRRSDGSAIEVEFGSQLLPGGRIISIVRDITVRKAAEAAVERRLELEARLSRLAATVPGAIFSLRVGADRVASFVYASEPIEELTGYTPEALRTDAGPLLARLPPDDRAAFARSIDDSGRSLTEWSTQFRYEHPRLGSRWVESRAMPVRDADAIVWHGFMMDVTERHELEERFRQAQKMEAIGQLASGVAHDFNNLLTVIQGNAALVAESPVTRHECVDEIAQAAERAAGLTQQLLLFSRKQDMRAVSLDLNEVVANVTKLLRRVVGEDISLVTAFAPCTATVRADVGMLEQVLLNLSVNARDAMPRGGRLTIETAVMEPDGDGRGWVHLRVSDTGHGIAPEVMPRIFEPFFTTKDVGKGTGLGLATVYAIVKQHGGTVDVRNGSERGTTFEIRLPLERDEAPLPASPDRDAGAPGGHETILVVEDEPSVRMLVSYLLTTGGYEVVTAESGRAAIEIFERRADVIDLLLTDMVMPDGLTGRELAEQLVARKPSLKVLYTSGYSPDVAAKGLALIKGRNFIQKPYLPRELSEAVRTALDLHE